MARSAVGIPDRSIFGRGSSLRPGLAEWVVQRHLARRAGPHYDIRVGTPWGQLFSWAGKHLPGPGERRMVWQQPLHEGQYADFEGEIGKGYGRGMVKKHDRGRVLVTEASDDKISFVLAHKRFPERFTLIRSPTSPNRGWLMINTTPTKPESAGKLRYTKVPAEDVGRLFDPEYLASEKIDGASALIKLLDDKIEVLSYRTSASGRPIVHTERLAGGPIRAKIPRELRGKTLRGELYGVREGKAIPPQELGGLLNATLAETIRRKKERGTDLRVALFDVAGEEDRPYPERFAALRAATRHLPARFFHLPRTAESPEEMRGLWEDTVGGRNPLTSEGIIVHSRKGGKPIKVKQRPEDKVVVRGVFPGTGKYRDAAGGLEYSLTKSGPVVGRIGSGFTDEARREMLKDPRAWIGRIARITSQGKFPSGAHRAPSFLALHEDYDFVPEDEEDEEEKRMRRMLQQKAASDIDWDERLNRLAERRGETREELDRRTQKALEGGVLTDMRMFDGLTGGLPKTAASSPADVVQFYLKRAAEKRKKGRCWEGYEPVPGKEPYSEDSCRPKRRKKTAGDMFEDATELESPEPPKTKVRDRCPPGSRWKDGRCQKTEPQSMKVAAPTLARLLQTRQKTAAGPSLLANMAAMGLMGAGAGAMAGAGKAHFGRAPGTDPVTAQSAAWDPMRGGQAISDSLAGAGVGVAVGALKYALQKAFPQFFLPRTMDEADG